VAGGSDGLLRALVIAWDTDQPHRFAHALTAARRYLGVPDPVCREESPPAPVIREDVALSLVPRRESSPSPETPF
jgi:hypothetical protein